MTSFIRCLLTAPAERVVFERASGAPITAGQLRATAAMQIPHHQASTGRLYAFSKNASGLAVAILVAAKCRRELVVLPQDGRAYRESVGCADVDFLGNFELVAAPGASTVEIDSEDLDLTFFTSGSSGAAKEIHKPIGLLEAEARYWLRIIGADVKNVAGTVSHQHIYGMIFRLMFPVMGGIPSRDDAALSWEALLAATGPQTLVVSGPAHLTRLPPLTLQAETRPHMILSSGGPLPEEAAKEAAALFGCLPVEIFGSTETGGVATRQRDRTDTPWTPLEGMRFDTTSSGETRLHSPFLPEGAVQKLDDHLQFAPDGTFQLVARTDRIVKVEGKRVSLARVESAIKSHPLVHDAAVVITISAGRDRLSALIVLTPEGSLQFGQTRAFGLGKQIFADLRETLEPAEVPKRWRFVPAIPVNAQSKRNMAAIGEAFEGRPLLELLKPASFETKGFTSELAFDAAPDLPWFNGHFPGLPILPGLSQVHIAVRLAEEIWGMGPACMKVSRMKFHRIIQPGERIELKLSVNVETGQIQFAFHFQNVLVSTGTVG